MSSDIIMDKIICEFYRKKIILQGNFVLKSGQQSDYYINCRKISEYPQLMKIYRDKKNIKIFYIRRWMRTLPIFFIALISFKQSF